MRKTSQLGEKGKENITLTTMPSVLIICHEQKRHKIPFFGWLIFVLQIAISCAIVMYTVH